MDASNYGSKHDHARFRKLFESEVQHNKTVPFVKHHCEKYEGNFPIWVATELFSFGMLSFFYRDLKTADKKEIARTCIKPLMAISIAGCAAVQICAISARITGVCIIVSFLRYRPRQRGFLLCYNAAFLITS